MSRYTTVEQLIQEGDDGTLIDVILRINGRLHKVFSGEYFDDAVDRLRSALADGFEVELEEHDPHEGSQYELLHGEIDFQD